ncbi:MAG: SixA phosphatase family protein [Vicingaceae bacterium]
MKTLYLIRHANSDWNQSGFNDFNRPLSNNGPKDATEISLKLQQLKFNPDLIICSSAKRTSQTAALLCQNISYNFKDIQFEQSIYETTLNHLIEFTNHLPNSKNTIAIIGHNPSISELSNYLTENHISNMPPCGVVKIELEIKNWNEIISGIGSLKYFFHP